MRQKFGSSSGLRSSGKMQGIGSDANYDENPANFAIDMNQIKETSQKALAFVSSSLSLIGDQVSKVSV